MNFYEFLIWNFSEWVHKYADCHRFSNCTGICWNIRKYAEILSIPGKIFKKIRVCVWRKDVIRSRYHVEIYIPNDCCTGLLRTVTFGATSGSAGAARSRSTSGAGRTRRAAAPARCDPSLEEQSGRWQGKRGGPWPQVWSIISKKTALACWKWCIFTETTVTNVGYQKTQQLTSFKTPIGECKSCPRLPKCRADANAHASGNPLV